uniref:Bm9739 n=1 Tax=Brugia malayi TaxID=6279 RepID=A0A0I9R2Y4_BRUMA|nr:Bm9739 [Brugia malayi]
MASSNNGKCRISSYCVIIRNPKIINALAAANALEMWDMRKAIIEQLRILASKPESAPFAISVAVCNLEKNKAKYVVKHSTTSENQVAIGLAAQAIKVWCCNDDQRYTIEFEAPKELLLSNKPKLIGLQLEAIVECPN